MIPEQLDQVEEIGARISLQGHSQSSDDMKNDLQCFLDHDCRFTTQIWLLLYLLLFLWGQRKEVEYQEQGTLVCRVKFIEFVLHSLRQPL